MTTVVPAGSGRVALRAFGLLLLMTVGAIATMLAWLKTHEAQLVFQAAASHRRHEPPLPSYAEPLTIAEPAGVRLAAIVLHADPSHDNGFWVLHLHGNADSAFSALQLRHAEQLHAAGFSVLCFDYRGFGHTPGVVSEAHIDAEAEAAYAALIQRGVPASRIILWGHSLGSAPAVELAATHPAAALVLFGAFSSIADVAADTYRYLPVRWIVGIRMNSLRRIRSVHMPVLIVHSVSDTIVPFHEGQQLYAAANAPRFVALTAAADDGFGGHVSALYDHLNQVMPQLAALIGSPL